MPRNACHDCGHPTDFRFCTRCATAHAETDGAGRSHGRPERGQHSLKRKLRPLVFADHDGICARCDERIDPDEDWELGHVVPHVAGGPFQRENLRPEHKRCNRMAGAA